MTDYEVDTSILINLNYDDRECKVSCSKQKEAAVKK